MVQKCSLSKPLLWTVGGYGYLFFLPEQVGAGANSSALVGFLEQLGAVASGFVHQHIAIVRTEDAAPVQSTHNALQSCHLSLAVWYGFFIQYEGLHTCLGVRGKFGCVTCSAPLLPRLLAPPPPPPLLPPSQLVAPLLSRQGHCPIPCSCLSTGFRAREALVNCEHINALAPLL